MNGAASIRATQAYRAGGALTYGPFDAVPDRKEFLSVRSQNFHRLGLQTYTKPYTVFALRKIMLYFTNTYCSLVPLKICYPFGCAGSSPAVRTIGPEEFVMRRGLARSLAAASAMAAILTLSGCGLFGQDDPVQIAAIGPLLPSPNPANGNLSAPNAAYLSATAQGLVSIDAEGQTDLGLAERWTVTADGLSYIFRLREASWSNGRRVVAQDIARMLTSYIAPTSRHPLRSDFSSVESIRAMTDQVIEIRLRRPDAHILELLAHPGMTLPSRGRGWGPLEARRGAASIMLVPQPDPLAEDPDAAREAVEDPSGWVELRGLSAASAVARYSEGEVDGVFGGRFADFPIYIGSQISRSRLIVDPVPGLFGLAVVNPSGFLQSDTGRDAVSMAINRDQLISAFGLEEWTPQLSLRLSQKLRAPDVPPTFPAWINLQMEERRRRAADIVAAYKAKGRTIAPLRIALPQGSGSRILFAWIAADLKAVGLSAKRVRPNESADLRLIDEVAPADDPAWALHRLSCGREISCSREAEARLQSAMSAPDPESRSARLAEAEGLMVGHAAWIPLATPLRWGLASPRLNGVRANNRGEHPLTRLRTPPT
jgi:oligopeptide transport system substrate-binding protein